MNEDDDSYDGGGRLDPPTGSSSNGSNAGTAVGGNRRSSISVYDALIDGGNGNERPPDDWGDDYRSLYDGSDAYYAASSNAASSSALSSGAPTSDYGASEISGGSGKWMSSGVR